MTWNQFDFGLAGSPTSRAAVDRFKIASAGRAWVSIIAITHNPSTLLQVVLCFSSVNAAGPPSHSPTVPAFTRLPEFQRNLQHSALCLNPAHCLSLWLYSAALLHPPDSICIRNYDGPPIDVDLAENTASLETLLHGLEDPLLVWKEFNLGHSFGVILACRFILILTRRIASRQVALMCTSLR